MWTQEYVTHGHDFQRNKKLVWKIKPYLINIGSKYSPHLHVLHRLIREYNSFSGLSIWSPLLLFCRRAWAGHHVLYTFPQAQHGYRLLPLFPRFLCWYVQLLAAFQKLFGHTCPEKLLLSPFTHGRAEFANVCTSMQNLQQTISCS